eukprot:TCONS_00034225-protein
MKNSFTIACIFLAVWSTAYSLNGLDLKKPRQFVKALNMVNQECNAVNVRAMKAMMTTDPSKVDIVKTQAKIDGLLDDVEKLEHALSKLRLGPRQRKGLTKKLENLKKKVQMKANSLSSITENASCFGQKSIFNAHLAKADSSFNNLLEQFDKVKEECNVFSKPCVHKFTHIKEKFSKLNMNNVQPIKGKVDELKTAGCFVSQADRAAYSKKMLDIECRVEGMIIFVQSALSDLIKAELMIVSDTKTTLESLLNGNVSMETDVKGNKLDTRAIHLKIKDIFHQSIVLKKRFIIVYDCIYDIRGWIAGADYDNLHVGANDMYWGLGNLCVSIDNALTLWDRLEKEECFKEDVDKKKKEVTQLETDINSVFSEIGDTASMVCGDLLNKARTETEKLKVKLTVCGNEANRLKAQVTKELTTGDELMIIMGDVDMIITDIKTHNTLAEKNHYFLRIFDHLYCLDD